MHTCGSRENCRVLLEVMTELCFLSCWTLNHGTAKLLRLERDSLRLHSCCVGECSKLCSVFCPDIAQWLLWCFWGLANGQLNRRNLPASLAFWLLLLPSPLHCFTTAPSLQPLHTPHFLDTPSPNCSHYHRLMSGAACASRCPWGARKRAWMSVFFSPKCRWLVIRLACQMCCQYHSSHLSQPSM